MRSLSLKRAEFVELSTEILGGAGSLHFVAHGSSMSPFIRDGDALTVQPVPSDGLRVGDVAFYRNAEDGLAAHRIVHRRTEGEQVRFTMHGDAVPGPGEDVGAEQVLGRVVCVHRCSKVIRQDRIIRRMMARIWIGLLPLHFPRWVRKVKAAGVRLFRHL